MPSGAAIFGELPSASLFKFPPGHNPFGVPPPPVGPGSSTAFHIPDHIFTAALDPKVPITIAALYAVSVKLTNRYNVSTGKKPWAISKTAAFRVFVVLHNLFLAVYSAWTFWGMLGGMRRSVASPFGPNGVAATMDSLCQVNGAPGLGAATVFDEASGRWTMLGDSAPALGLDGSPARDVYGRLWNEGLAFYGWIFYLSKFYEVLDTFIILAKGKLSSTLQTYHHAGAMMCMWAGIRYMALPIWVFVLVNSFIHTLMYTYYTVTAFNIRVPTRIKRTLTTMQITQFIFGASYTMVHSFVSYTVPVAIYKESTAAAVSSEATTAAAGGATEAVRTVASGAFEGLKQMIYGASASASVVGGNSVPSARAGYNPPPSSGVAVETVWVKQPCVDTSGETFAIWLNVLYLAPLTYLFVMFFIRSYLRRSSAAAEKAIRGKSRRQSSVAMAEKAGWDAARDVNREIYENGVEELADEPVVKTNGRTSRSRRT